MNDFDCESCSWFIRVVFKEFVFGVGMSSEMSNVSRELSTNTNFASLGDSDDFIKGGLSNAFSV